MKKCFPQILMISMFVTLTSFSQESIKANVETTNQSIISNTSRSEQYKTLFAAFVASDLDDILVDEGSFTVFAPSDEAFDALFDSNTTSLLDPKNKAELQTLLRYHIIAGEFSASQILKAMCNGEGSATFMTVQGEELTATMSGTDILLTDGIGHTAKITVADSNQCNGVIHEIDSVILPKKINLLP